MFKTKKDVSAPKVPLMRKDITYINGVQMEEAVEITRHCFFQDGEMELWEQKIRNASDFKDAYVGMIRYWNFERCIAEMHKFTQKDSFFYYGNCAVCNSPQPFIVDFQFADGDQSINWRERLVCPNCGCNSRQRFMIDKIFSNYKAGMEVLLYEQNTNVFRKVSREITSVTGFEHSIDNAKKGKTQNGIAYQDACQLTYDSKCFDIVVANEVFGRVQDYKKAFQEAARITKTGGRIIFTVPFNGNSEETVKAGDINIFGWDVLDTLKEYGFSDAYGCVYYGLKNGYMGYLPLYFEAIK